MRGDFRLCLIVGEKSIEVKEELAMTTQSEPVRFDRDYLVTRMHAYLRIGN